MKTRDRRPIDVATIESICELYSKGFSKARIAKLLGITENCIRMYIQSTEAAKNEGMVKKPQAITKTLRAWCRKHGYPVPEVEPIEEDEEEERPASQEKPVETIQEKTVETVYIRDGHYMTKIIRQLDRAVDLLEALVKEFK